MATFEVYPAINSQPGDIADVRRKLEIVKKISSRVHLDCADGKFTFNKSWCSPADWRTFKTDLELEVHLMFEDPVGELPAWSRAGAKRAIACLDSFLHLAFSRRDRPLSEGVRFIDECEKWGMQPMLSVALHNDLKSVSDILSLFSCYQVFSQNSYGPSGQPLLSGALSRIEYLHKRFPGATIEVDGGIVPETARLAYDAGASAVVSGSYIFNSPNPTLAVKELESVR